MVYSFPFVSLHPKFIMEDKNHFLQKATELFIEHGAKTLTMDDVAKEFGISKKTLYQKYKNKEALLEDVLAFKLEEIITKMKKLDLEIDNAIERMFCRDEDIERAIMSNESALIKQLVKYYPTIFIRHMTDFSDKFSEVLVHNIEKGRKQGYYREDFDAKVYARIFFQLMMSYDSSPFMENCCAGRQQYIDAALLFYMNVITTEKGKEILKNKKLNEKTV